MFGKLKSESLEFSKTAKHFDLHLKFAFFWHFKGIQHVFLAHQKIKGLDGGLEPPTSGFPVHCSTT